MSTSSRPGRLARKAGMVAARDRKAQARVIVSAERLPDDADTRGGE